MTTSDLFDAAALDDFQDQIDNHLVLEPVGARQYCAAFEAWLDQRSPCDTVSESQIDTWRGSLFYLRGFFAYADGDVDAATEHFTLAAACSERTANMRHLALVLRRLALCHEYAGRQSESVDCVFRALEVAEKLGDDRLTVQALAVLAALYDSQGAFEFTYETSIRMGDIARELEDPYLCALSYSYAGLSSGYLNEPERGLEWIDKSLAVNAGGAWPQLATYNHIYQFVLFHVAGRIDEAVVAAEAQLEQIARLPAQNAAATYVHVAEIHVSAGNLDRAEEMLLLAERAGRGAKLNGHLLRHHQVAADLHEARGESALALEKLRKHVELTSELRGRQARARLVTVERRFAGELAKKTEEIHHLRTVELVEKNDQLAVLNRQKDEILNVVAHDLRNPLAAAQMLSESLLIEAEQGLGADGMEQLRSIRAATSEIGATIDTLLHLQQHDSPSVMSAVDDVVERSIAWAAGPATERQIALHVDIAPIGFEVDGALLRRSLDDVLWLAVQATEPEATIDVSARPSGDGARIVISYCCATGKPDDRSLYIARRLVERMRGSITIHSPDVPARDGTIRTSAVIDLRAP